MGELPRQLIRFSLRNKVGSLHRVYQHFYLGVREKPVRHIVPVLITDLLAHYLVAEFIQSLYVRLYRTVVRFDLILGESCYELIGRHHVMLVRVVPEDLVDPEKLYLDFVFHKTASGAFYNLSILPIFVP